MAKKRTIVVPFEAVERDDSFNARTVYKNIEELAASIQQNGLLETIGVAEKKNEPGKYIVVYGFRRHKALELIRAKLGPDAWSELEVIVNEGTREELHDRMVKENLDRENLEPHEIATLIKKMANSGLEQRDIAARLGRPQSWVSYHYKLATKLGSAAWSALKEGKLTLEQALHVADTAEEDQQEVVTAVLGASTRTEARQIAKKASEIAGGRRTYVNKGRPTAKNLAQYVSDASFDGAREGSAEDQEAAVSQSFYNGVAAGLRVAMGDTQFGNLLPKNSYFDTEFHIKKKAAATEGGEPEETEAAEVEEAEASEPKPKKARKAAKAASDNTTSTPKRRGRPPKDKIVAAPPELPDMSDEFSQEDIQAGVFGDGEDEEGQATVTAPANPPKRRGRPPKNRLLQDNA